MPCRSSQNCSWTSGASFGRRRIRPDGATTDGHRPGSRAGRLPKSRFQASKSKQAPTSKHQCSKRRANRAWRLVPGACNASCKSCLHRMLWSAARWSQDIGFRLYEIPRLVDFSPSSLVNSPQRRDRSNRTCRGSSRQRGRVARDRHAGPTID
jgi:hypothetical protein